MSDIATTKETHRYIPHSTTKWFFLSNLDKKYNIARNSYTDKKINTEFALSNALENLKEIVSPAEIKNISEELISKYSPNVKIIGSLYKLSNGIEAKIVCSEQQNYYLRFIKNNDSYDLEHSEFSGMFDALIKYPEDYTDSNLAGKSELYSDFIPGLFVDPDSSKADYGKLMERYHQNISLYDDKYEDLDIDQLFKKVILEEYFSQL